MSYKLLVFDWDGTLMDSEARIVACIQSAFADLGEMPPPREIAREVIGLGLEEAMTMLWPDGSVLQRRELVDRYRFHFLGGQETESPLFPGARELVQDLNARGLLLAVATGKSRRGLESALTSTGLRSHFHATRCADETFSKPHPEMLLQVMAELGADRSETLMIGDTEFDMEMARNAGVAALAVAYGVHHPERLLRHEPLDCLNELQELRDWLERHLEP
ncbi:MAG: HAD-IA family hydrolase [Chromatiaceae bacterium]|nr:HAD-IA family hydrolase [Chromatiaceae bacterium]HSO79234.1 HAD-IA family hydrolase [Chromatiaceae bacterium]